MSLSIWCDDQRDPKKHGRGGYLWIKTAKGCIHALKTGKVRILSLDHDLGLGNENEKEPSGMTVLDWLEQHPEHLPESIRIHSQNPVGRLRMEQLIERLYRNRR